MIDPMCALPSGLAPQRHDVIALVASRIPASTGDDCVRVAVDGVDGVGKTTFANDLADFLRSRGRAVVRISVDDFHNPRVVRYRRGRESPDGFWLDSFDYSRLHIDVLAPFGPGGDRRYRRASHDLASDVELRPSPSQAPPGAVLVIDGLFLHRDELVGQWDFSVWLDAPIAVTVARLAMRDGTPPDPCHQSLRRYVDGQRLYLALCDPAARADVVIDVTDPDRPRLARRRQVAAEAKEDGIDGSTDHH
jgi:uridine kinase